MKSERARAIKWNMLSGWALELFTLISGLILPRLILITYGSSANGLVGAISQYLGFSTVFRAGLGGVVRAALYKPLAENDMGSVSSIMAATGMYMRKVAMFVAMYIAIIGVVLPFIAESEYTWEFVFSMVLIVGSSVFADNFFSIKARILLQADQKYYVQTLCALISHMASFTVSLVMIKAGCSLIVMKFGVALAAFLDPILLNLYVRGRYRLDMYAKPDNTAIGQRWDAFAQQLAVVVNGNVDLVILSALVSMKEISVYTVHNMIVLNMKKIVESCVTGINSMFGDMIAKNEQETLVKTFRFIEWAYFSVCTVIFSTTAILLTPFIGLYTDSVTDVDYIRPLFAFFITLAAFLSCVRLPYQMLVEAAGIFRQTRNGAIFEVVINVMSSVVFVLFFGIIGVLYGTCVAAIIRTSQYIIHAAESVLHMRAITLLRAYGGYLALFIGIVMVETVFPLPLPQSYLVWCMYGVLTVGYSGIVVLLISLVTNREFLFKVTKIIFKRIGAR